ncbi:hypothetical protein GGP41_007022 [Bipolaris sorokiniana]|uniref:Uncharacterized protein n=1 Tax=Cochliobolus sativus TaxID=45130 RepID=A0A8H5ZPY4_COCSA|nr:hypothetical protein GGP41_007022 [Bipolaris sorokiniana]
MPRGCNHSSAQLAFLINNIHHTVCYELISLPCTASKFIISLFSAYAVHLSILASCSLILRAARKMVASK